MKISKEQFAIACNAVTEIATVSNDTELLQQIDWLKLPTDSSDEEMVEWVNSLVHLNFEAEYDNGDLRWSIAYYDRDGDISDTNDIEIHADRAILIIAEVLDYQID